MQYPPPCILVIYGASGDLAGRKLLPALRELAAQGLLHDQTSIVGFGRSNLTDQQFRDHCKTQIQHFGSPNPSDPDSLNRFLQKIHYHPGDYASPSDHAALAARLNALGANRVHYLATPPDAFENLILHIGQSSQNIPGFNRIIIEKPFGKDYSSAHRLNQLLHRYFPETDIYRIDHFLGKETVQNLMVLRFANSIFEPLWNSRYIDHVQITVAESVGLENRAGYYDASGALRDMIQNHLFQLLALIAMEPPADLAANSIRDEKVKVFRSIRSLSQTAVANFAARGQYAEGQHLSKSTPGYRLEKNVPPQSTTETFAALKLHIDNWRWSGAPFYLRTGKFLQEKITEAVIRFREPPRTLFNKQCKTPIYPNDLIIRIQPQEGISLRINGKVPGGELAINSVSMNFLYNTTFKKAPPDAYQRLLHDAMLGDQSLFIRADESETAWQIVDPIQQAWKTSGVLPELYVPGSWGPKKAQDLIERDGRRWLHSNDDPEPLSACAL